MIILSSTQCTMSVSHMFFPLSRTSPDQLAPMALCDFQSETLQKVLQRVALNCLHAAVTII